MQAKYARILVSLILFAFLGLSLTGGEKALADTAIYRASLAGNKNRLVTVKKSGESLTIVLEGFGSQPIELKANGGGTSSCRTVIEHTSAQGTVILSLAIPDPRARCRALPSFVSIESRSYNISIDEENIRKITGANAAVRSTVKKILGVIDAEEG